jgi:hypothetical protein
VLVYGDQQATGSARSFVAEVRRLATALDAEAGGIFWHQACVALFIATAELAQGVADAEFAVAGHDTVSASQATLMAALRTLAHAIDLSWHSNFAQQYAPRLALDALAAESLPTTLTIRRCEGYAFYALYPEQYLAAARDVPRGACVIGLRSIGTGLAALVASACDAEFVCTVRPIGDVYARTVAVGAELEAAIRLRRDRIFALVDEGPGQSGSSLGGVADYLEALGVARSQIIFLPSHAGDLGANAQPAHRQRWQAAKRLSVEFEEVFMGDGDRSLPTWFEDVAGRAIAPLRDLSGGRWRGAGPHVEAPADLGREARKYLLTTARGTYLLKFVGLDAEASGKLARARRLYEAGFSPEPIALRHGFLATRWMPVERAATTAEIWPVIAPYLSFRAETFPADTVGASLSKLLAAARYNLRQAVGGSAEILFDAWPDDRVAALQRCVRPVQVDGRMHRWEWIAGRLGVLKTDAVDHARAHDLVGCQDIAWDVAGAIVEFGVSDAQGEQLVRAVLGDRTEMADLTALLILCYLGFQIGWWDFAAEPDSAARQRRFYASHVEVLVRRSL